MIKEEFKAVKLIRFGSAKNNFIATKILYSQFTHKVPSLNVHYWPSFLHIGYKKGREMKNWQMLMQLLESFCWVRITKTKLNYLNILRDFRDSQVLFNGNLGVIC